MMPPSEQDERPGCIPRPLPGGADGPPLAEDLHFELAPELVAPSIARERFERWLRDLGWPSGQSDDLVLALSEAVSNSIEHGYRIHPGPAPEPLGAGAVEVRARVLTEANGVRRIALTVRDHGRWREPIGPARFRGHGLSIIRACADEFDINGDDTGTTLTLTSRAAPAPPAAP
ncbi:anti-sigma regulatory factor (Ser/Thr protein kinase) [Pseudonocardia hierapolitana]|uniref:Anti-sigma regulatory factor (Ser/Thr protein kinase) n=2 Tax=Pseudonocardia hierapolitana TaxID=1128676 RepID=A0A561STM9_9PSEU|nr:anti-sigma regulatory factor (Ser/Thr protein kinase) [Pseudonocardia hierapolitana]